jgi:hypothetical protein
VPAVLAFAGPAFLVAVVGAGFLPFAALWWTAALAVASIRSRAARIRVCVALIPVCVLTAFEGGLFVLPSVVAMCAIDVGRGSRLRRAAQGGGRAGA